MLTKVLPFLVYLASFPLMIISVSRVDIGMMYFVTFIPVIAVMKKIAEYPMGNNVVDLMLVSMIIGWFISVSKRNVKLIITSPINIVVVLVIVGSLINFLRGYFYSDLTMEVNIIRLKAWKNYMILPVLYFIAANSLDTEKKVRAIIFCLIVTLIAMDFNFYSTFRWIRAEHYSHSIRISGPFSFLGPNEVGVFFTMYTFLFLGISYYIEKKWMRYLILFVCACNFYPILFSYSRAAYISTFIGFIALGILKDRRVLLIMLVVILAYRVVLPNSVVERIDMTFLHKEEISEDLEQSSAVDVGGVSLNTVGRKELWQKAKDYFVEQPILGIGFDTFRHREGMITHSMYMKILAEQGILGLTIFISFILTLLRQTYILYKKSATSLGQGVGLGFLLCIIIHLSGSISGDQSLYYNLMAVFWIFMGIVAAFNSKSTEYNLDVQNSLVNT